MLRFKITGEKWIYIDRGLAGGQSLITVEDSLRDATGRMPIGCHVVEILWRAWCPCGRPALGARDARL